MRKSILKLCNKPLEIVFNYFKQDRGVPPQVIEKNCGTSLAMISKFYGKFLPSDQANQLNRVELLPSPGDK